MHHQQPLFGRENKRTSSKATSNDALGDAVSGMVNVVSILSQALSPNTQQRTATDKGRRTSTSTSTTLSPMKSAELLFFYLKKMTELKGLFDNSILSQAEYEEQRTEIVESMRRLKK